MTFENGQQVLINEPFSLKNRFFFFGKKYWLGSVELGEFVSEFWCQESEVLKILVKVEIVWEKVEIL